MDDNGKTLLTTIGLFASIGWAAIAHLYKLVFDRPTFKRIDDLESRLNQRLDAQDEKLWKMSQELSRLSGKSSGYFGRFNPGRRHSDDEDEKDG